jgi:hypothetical protein
VRRTSAVLAIRSHRRPDAISRAAQFFEAGVSFSRWPTLHHVTSYIYAMNGGAENANRLAVGCRVRTTDESHATGEIVEDYGELAGTEVVVDATHTAKARRWAVALDDGSIAFLDDDAIELIDNGS